MTTFHRALNGKIAMCTARTRPCPRTEHFDQWEGARLIAEQDKARAAAKAAKAAAKPKYLLHERGAVTEVPVAPAGKEPFRCPRCNRYMSRGFMESAALANDFYHHCPHCQFKAELTDWHIGILPSSVRLLDDEVAAKAKWYHLTKDEHWAEKMAAFQPTDFSTPLVHVGTKDTATRHGTLRYFGGVKTHLYEIELQPGIRFASNLQKDVDHGWPDTVGNISRPDFPFTPSFAEQGFVSDGATRYLNHFEGAGTISLLLPAHLFTATRIS